MLKKYGSETVTDKDDGTPTKRRRPARRAEMAKQAEINRNSAVKRRNATRSSSDRCPVKR